MALIHSHNIFFSLLCARVVGVRHKHVLMAFHGDGTGHPPFHGPLLVVEKRRRHLLLLVFFPDQDRSAELKVQLNEPVCRHLDSNCRRVVHLGRLQEIDA